MSNHSLIHRDVHNECGTWSKTNNKCGVLFFIKEKNPIADTLRFSVMGRNLTFHEGVSSVKVRMGKSSAFWILCICRYIQLYQVWPYKWVKTTMICLITNIYKKKCTHWQTAVVKKKGIKQWYEVYFIWRCISLLCARPHRAISALFSYSSSLCCALYPSECAGYSQITARQ